MPNFPSIYIELQELWKRLRILSSTIEKIQEAIEDLQNKTQCMEYITDPTNSTQFKCDVRISGSADPKLFVGDKVDLLTPDEVAVFNKTSNLGYVTVRNTDNRLSIGVDSSHSFLSSSNDLAILKDGEIRTHIQGNATDGTASFFSTMQVSNIPVASSIEENQYLVMRDEEGRLKSITIGDAISNSGDIETNGNDEWHRGYDGVLDQSSSLFQYERTNIAAEDNIGVVFKGYTAGETEGDFLTGDGKTAGGMTLEGGNQHSTNVNTNAGFSSVIGGYNFGGGKGGTVRLWGGGSENSEGGAVSVQSGKGLGGSGGINIATHQSYDGGDSGNIIIETGESNNDSGDITIRVGSGGVAGDINILGGYAPEVGGNINIHTQNGGDVDIKADGDSSYNPILNLSSSGDINITIGNEKNLNIHNIQEVSDEYRVLVKTTSGNKVKEITLENLNIDVQEATSTPGSYSLTGSFEGSAIFENFNIPQNAKFIRFVCIGPGGNGGNGTLSEFGTGGGGGGYSEATYKVSQLPETVVLVAGNSSNGISFVYGTIDGDNVPICMAERGRNGAPSSDDIGSYVSGGLGSSYGGLNLTHDGIFNRRYRRFTR